jgi:hypothetical protein
MRGMVPAYVIEQMESYAYTYASTTYQNPVVSGTTTNWSTLYPSSKIPMKDLF